MQSPRIGLVFWLWQCDKENHGWREGPPLTVVLAREFRSVEGLHPPEIFNSNEKRILPSVVIANLCILAIGRYTAVFLLACATRMHSMPQLWVMRSVHPRGYDAEDRETPSSIYWSDRRRLVQGSRITPDKSACDHLSPGGGDPGTRRSG